MALGTSLSSIGACKEPFDALANLDPAEAGALQRLLNESGVEPSALRKKDSPVQVAVTGGHVHRLVLTRVPTPPSLANLKDFAELERLEIIGSARSLDALPEDCGLLELRLASNGLTDLSALSRCDRLEGLWIVDEKLESLETLPSLPKLQELYVDQVPLSSLDGVGGRPALHTLLISRAGLRSLDGLEGLPKLRTLDLSKNAIADASVLDGLPELAEVNLADNELQSFPAVALRAEVPKISGNPGAEAVRKGQYQQSLAEAAARRAAERELEFADALPSVRGSMRRASKSLSWSGTEVEGSGSLGLITGTSIVELRKFSPTDVHSVSKRPAERRFEFTVQQGKARIYFGRGPGKVPYVEVEPGETRVIRTSMVAGDRWVGFFVEAVDGPVQELHFTVGPSS